MSKYVDFDAMWAESAPEETERPKIKVYGEEIALPVVLPARIMLRSLRAAGDAESDEKFMQRFEEIVGDLVALVGESKVNEWIDKGMTPTQLITIFTHCIGLYTPEQTDEGDEGNETAPKTGAKGTRSKQSSKNGA